MSGETSNPKNGGDGIVEGDATDNRIDLAYTGDPEGDRIDNSDAILPGEAPQDDIVDAGPGNDTILAEQGDDEVYAGAGDDSVRGGDGDDVLFGDSNLPGGIHDDTARDGSDAERISIKSGIEPRPGNEDTLLGGDGDDTLFGEAGDDKLAGGRGADSIFGGDDRDLIVGGNPGDFVDGGSGGDDFDTLDLRGDGPLRVVNQTVDPDGNSTSGTVEFLDKEDRVTGTMEFREIEKLLLPEDRNQDPVAGDDQAETDFETPVTIPVLDNDNDADGDTLSVTSVSDPANGAVTINGDGTVTFTPDEGFSGTDSFTYTVDDGNGGTDTATVTVTVNEAPPPARDGIVFGTPDDDLIDTNYDGDPDGDFVDNEDALLPGAAPNDDSIRAGDGDDTVFAGLGDDRVEGGDGNDSIFGGPGDDFIDAGAPLSPAPLPDLGFPPNVPADSDPDNDRDFVSGGDGNDTILTGDDADTITGGAGDDFLDGGIDADIIDGDEGDDTIIGGEGSDTIDGGAGDDLIFGGLDPSFPDALNIPDDTDPVPDNGRDLIFGGDGNDTIFGQDDNDTIFGGDGDDSIDGGIDNDEIFGGDGNDTLLGGAGNDTIDGGAGSNLMRGGDDRDLFLNAGPGDTVDGGSGGDDFDTLDLRGSGPLRVVDETVDADGDSTSGTVEFLDAPGGDVTGTLTFREIEDLIPCFTPGTAIATPRGEVLVENLQVGDRVITRDNGLQEIRWIGKRALTGRELQRAPHLGPVLIRAGALGRGLPERDMLVSPQHRLLMNTDRSALYFDEHEVLAAAKHLTGLDGVDKVAASGTTYIHFMFDQHEVVLSNGAWTESFQPGEQVIDGLGDAQRDELYELFPDLREAKGIAAYQAARRSLRKHEALLLVK